MGTLKTPASPATDAGYSYCAKHHLLPLALAPHFPPHPAQGPISVQWLLPGLRGSPAAPCRLTSWVLASEMGTYSSLPSSPHLPFNDDGSCCQHAATVINTLLNNTGCPSY